MTIDTPFIVVSGQPSFEEQRQTWGSGIFGVSVDAELSSLNAQFGFNQTPHQFSLEYVANAFSNEQLPTVGSGVQFYIGQNFLIQGRITHSDFAKSARGNIITVNVEDLRTDLSNIYIDTYGIFGSADSPINNIVDIRYWYVKTFAETRALGRSRIAKDLDLLDRHGASYRQIYDAVKYFEEQLGTINDILSKIPEPEVIEAQLPESPDSYRWQFKSQPLLEVLARILGDVSYDFYWNMSERKINVINRKYEITIGRNDIPVAGDPASIVSLRYGTDQAERATSVYLLGAPMEGLIGAGGLKTESGAYGISSSGTAGHTQYDLGVSVIGGPSNPGRSKPTFVPGWRNARIKYFGADGSLREDRPSDRELKAALKGIEYWTLEKNLENRIDAATVTQNEGITKAQLSAASPSGLGLIPNRGQPGREWILEWFNRVRNFAQNHFGRTYVLSKTSLLYDEIDDFDIISAAWCNIENLTDSDSFEDGYVIKRKYRFLAPFWDHENNKMRAWASFNISDLPGKGVISPKWGADGKGSPGQFTAYNEDEHVQYVPIEVMKWTRAEDKFQEEFLNPLFQDEKGIMIRLPTVCWQRYDLDLPDSKYNNKPILKFFRGSFTGSTQSDIVSDPVSIGTVYETITDVALPIRTKRRYGYRWPSIWASGSGSDLSVEIMDDLAPWSYEPRGNQTSWQLMESEARSILSSLVSTRDSATFAEVQKLDLPIISFDSFANQSLTNQGYGIVSHGVTNLNISKSEEWWQTRYSIKSHYAQLIKAKPVKEVTEEDFEFVIRRLEQRIPPLPLDAFTSPPVFDPKTDDGVKIFTQSIKNTLTIPVTITQIVGDTSNPSYVGIDDKGSTWPAAFRDLTSLNTESIYYRDRNAFAVDGFLQVGMRAVYHYEDKEDGTFTHYFTGGIQLSASRIVELLEAPRLVNNIYRANVRTISETVVDSQGNPVTVTPFTIRNVPFLNQQAVDTNLASGDKLFMGSNGNENTVVQPNFDVAAGNSNGVGVDSVQLINSGVPSTVGIATVTGRPNTTTGLQGAIQTISTAGGQNITDGDTIGGQIYNVRFVGVEYDQVAIGDPCITIAQKEQGVSGQTRLYCFIIKPLFAPFSAAGENFI